MSGHGFVLTVLGLVGALGVAGVWARPATAESKSGGEIVQDVQVGLSAGLPTIRLTEPEREAFLEILGNHLHPTVDLDDQSEPTRINQDDASNTAADDPGMATDHYGKDKRDGRFGPNIGPFISAGRIGDGWANRPGIVPLASPVKEAEMSGSGAWKRKVSGKLCYINPIACFGRRQRESAL